MAEGSQVLEAQQLYLQRLHLESQFELQQLLFKGCVWPRYIASGHCIKCVSLQPMKASIQVKKNGTGRISTSLQIKITPKTTVYSVYSSCFSINQHVQPACVQFQGFMNAVFRSCIISIPQQNSFSQRQSAREPRDVLKTAGSQGTWKFVETAWKKDSQNLEFSKPPIPIT